MAASRPDTFWDTIERTLAGILGLIAMALGLVQVLGRYFFPAYAISWGEEVIVYLSFGA
jgi:C4-dicarboxylate transporter DctQ subunit